MKTHSRTVATAIAAGVAAAALMALPVAADDLRLGVGTEPTSIDPHYWSGFPNVQLGLTIFGHLVNYDSSFRLAPGLATSWKAIDDTTWEFKLRDTKWHDGTPFTADDVIYTFERAPEVGLKQFGLYTRGKKVTKIDDRTIHIKTATPDPTVPNALAAFAIVSKKHSDGMKVEDFNSGKAAIGIGPFKFVEWVKGDRLVLAANPDYWGGKPAFDRVVQKPISSGPSRVAALLSGELDMIDKVPTTDIAKLKKDGRVNIVQTPSCRVMFVQLDVGRDLSPDVKTNDGKPMWPNPLRDWRVRKAVTMAIDRPAIVDRVMDGNAVAASQTFGKGLFGFNPNIPVEKYDPEGAKKLLQQAGYGEGFRITLSGTNDRYDNDAQILEAIAQMLTQIGIKTEVSAMPAATFFAKNTKQEFSVAMPGNCASTAEMGGQLKEFYHTVQPDRGLGIYNRHGYSNYRLDQMITDAMTVIDDAKREKMLQDAIAVAMADVALIPLHQQVNTWALKKGVSYEARTDEMTLPVYATRAR